MSWAITKPGDTGRVGRTVEVPGGTLATDDDVAHERNGIECDACAGFPTAPPGAPLRECKITADQYDSVMTLLVLPRAATMWAARDDDE